MSEINRLPNDELSLNDVSEPIRRAVKHIRSQSPPQENLQRALDRASAIKPIPRARWFNLRPEIQIRVAVAAAILVAVAIGFSANLVQRRVSRASSDQFALLDEPPVQFPPTATWKRITEIRKEGKEADEEPSRLPGRVNINGLGKEELEALIRQSNGTPDDWAPAGAFQGPIGPPGTSPEVKERLGGGILTPRSSQSNQLGLGANDPQILSGRIRGSNGSFSGGGLGGGGFGGGSFGGGGFGGGAGAGVGGFGGEGFAGRGFGGGPGGPAANQPQITDMMSRMRPSSSPVLSKSSPGPAGGPSDGKGWDQNQAGEVVRKKTTEDLKPPALHFDELKEYFDGDPKTSSTSASLRAGKPVNLREALQETARETYRRSATSNEQVKADKLRIDKTVDLADRWAEMPEADRNKALGDITRDAPKAYKEVITSYFNTLDKSNAYKDVLPRITESRTGSLLFGIGVNSDSGLTGSIVLGEVKEKKVAEKWGSMSLAERQKALDDITRELPARYKEPVAAYFSSLEKSKETKSPQVWRRDGQRPTFARVYLGGGNSLDLVSLQVNVTVEGPRARTVVDHIFHNPHDRQLEGTFEYPLPTGASVSYFGMFQGQARPNAPPRFANGGQPPQVRALTQPGLTAAKPESSTTNLGTQVPLQASSAALAGLNPSDLARQVSSADWGPVQEARVVSKQKALETYEDIVRTRIDPALLEYSGGNTFTGRVFPISPKGFNRVIIAYEELLPIVQEHALYRFSLPNRKLSEVQISLQANQSDFTKTQFFPKEAKKETGGDRVVYSHTWKDAEANGEVVFAGLPTRPQVQGISGKQGESGPTYLYARVRPQLKTETSRPFSDHAVFLLDTSLSEHPDRFAVSMKLWQQVLQSDPGIKKFNILAFNVGTSWIEPKGWLDNTPEGRGKALAKLDGIVLEGATDLSVALNRLATRGADATPLAGLGKSAPLEVFMLSDGQITWGNRDTNSLVANFEANCPYSARFHCYTIGLGAENIELFQALTRKGGGIYPCYSEAYLPHAALAHRKHCLLVERVSFKGGPEMTDVLVAGRQAAVYPGGDLVISARVANQSPPTAGLSRTKLVVEGTFLGERVVYEYPIDFKAGSDLAGRAFGELAVSSLLALNDSKLDSLATAYCQQFGIGSRVASFLVLENPADYKRLNLEEERGKVVPGGDLEKYLDDAWRNFAHAMKPKQAFEQLVKMLGSKIITPESASGADTTRLAGQDQVHRLLALLTDKDFELPEAVSGEALVHKKDVSPAYLAARQNDPMNVHVYLDEAKRRSTQATPPANAYALRVLSSIVEAYPSRADALRLVGYRLLDMQRPIDAARLFQQVESSRPFEPHSYRDLARSLEESGRYGFAALQYEIVLAGSWHNRFRDSLKEVAREEYAHMMQEALKEYRNSKSQASVSKELAEFFGERLEGMASVRQQADLRVTISWNTDNTDIDLWVMEPDGTKCFYQNQKTSSGGQLSQDQTQGYGPERYQVTKALPGVYTVIVHYYRADANLLAGETHVNVLVTKHAGTPEETVERHTVLLKQANEQVEVCKLKILQ
jgi:hypothetical protein